MKNLLVAQSGGPTSAINATLAGVVENALSSPSVDRIYGSINGIQGVLTENLSGRTFRSCYRENAALCRAGGTGTWIRYLFPHRFSVG